MRQITIEFCISNLVNGSLSVYYRLKEDFPQLEIRAERCLGYCGRCVNTFFALVDNELVEAETPDELCENIIYTIAEKTFTPNSYSGGRSTF
ncbi:DUF1450 domain-containing protein [Lihuaxuella thermophila]|uniref:Uncharacterized protein YuzB, UPF0349 family n=1 Tax=Lihuaxuella thermophila TaxID=1173111 RepID=A0A1H8HKT8_9BACL|nr:DUF1450 domain-containing protein [Lihuaxuella thermophila]SEN56790.1 Uncharacterized protein YuzB, UPF0349 family [Lihuaxuella thermophila]